MRIAYITSEIAPYSKTGGLADVSKALPKALGKYADVVCITPLYGDTDKSDMEKIDLEFTVFGEKFSVYRENEIYFLSSDIFNRIYGYGDDEIRFLKFCFAVLKLLDYLGDFDIIHLNDWQSSLLAFLLKRADCRSEIVLTIHNLAYQGIADKSIVDEFNLGWENFTFDKLEFHDKVNFLKSGIVYCDKFNTVSKEYAKEILTPTFSEGLGDVISEHSYKLRGILNGIDYNDFNPENDKSVIKNYTYETIRNKIVNKRILLNYFNLKNEDRPLFAFIGRLTSQKGVDLIVRNADFLSSFDMNFIILGSGDLNHIVEPLNKMDNIAVYLGYNESLARMIYASSDFFVMPSVFEPCGLGQIIAASYGCIPIVSSVGGLIDTVDADDENKIFGFRFFVNHYEMFQDAIKKAIDLYNNKESFIARKAENMKKRFSWDKSAKEYMKFYETKFKKPITGQNKEIKPQIYDIPSCYNENRANAMNVNPDLIYVYWNVKHELIEQYEDLKVVVVDSGKIIFAHDINSTCGEYFLNYSNKMRHLRVKIGIFKNDIFIDLVESRKVRVEFDEVATIVENITLKSKYYDKR